MPNSKNDEEKKMKRLVVIILCYLIISAQIGGEMLASDQGDKTGDFSKKNVRFREGELLDPKGIWVGGGHYLSLRGTYNIRCGPIKLAWAYKTFVAFYSRRQKERDYGIELAPTKWTDISEVNVFDP